MNIFEKLKQVFEKEAEVAEPQTLSLDELGIWIKQEIKKEEGNGVNECNPIIQEIEEVINDARTIIKKIDEREFSEEIEKRMYKPVKTAKPIFVKGMGEALRRIKTGELQNYEDMSSFNKSLLNSLKTIDNLQGGPGRHVSFVYREEMPRLGSELNSLIDLSNKLEEILKERGDNTEALKDILSNLKEVRIYKEKKLETTTKRKLLSKEINKIKRRGTALRKELNTLEKSDSFQKFLSIQKEVEALKEEKAKLIGQIYNQLHQLKRVFKKFRRIAENGSSELKEEDLAHVRDYIDDPLQTFLSEDIQELTLLIILKGARESIKNGELQLKAKEKSKTLDKIRLLEINCIDMRGRYEGINEKEKPLINKLSGSKVVAKREVLQKEIVGVEDDLEKLKRDELDLDKETKDRKRSIETQLKEIETLTSDIMGQGIKIHESASSSKEY